MKQRTAARLAWTLAALALLGVAATATMAILNRSVIHTVSEANPIEIVLPIGFALMGALVAIRRPRNPVGWIFLGIAFFGALPGFAQQYVIRDARVHHLPFAAWVAWTHDLPLTLVFPTGLATFFFLLFPDGRFASRWWRWLGWLAATFVAVGFAANFTQSTIQLGDLPVVRNPIGLDINIWNGPVGAVLWLGGIAILATAMVGTALRMRRSSGEERQQLKWLAYAAVATVIALVGLIVASLAHNNIQNGWFDLVIILGFGLAIPISCGVAMLKHGLYDIDVVVNKTLVYGVLAAFFTAVYVAVVVGIGTAIGSTRNPFLTVISAVVIATAFNPVRERAKRFANRIVYGRRATPYQVLTDFSERMAGTYAVDEVLPRMARTLAEATGARQATVWLRLGSELRPAATAPSANEFLESHPLSDGSLPAFEGVDRAVPVQHQGELLGALTLSKPASDPVTPAEDKLLSDLASQAGLVLHNASLTAELQANVEELRASRKRIVAAQDQERRRLERNIHDGAQQQLVALGIQLGLVERLIAKDPDKAGELVRQLAARASEAIDDLRDLARGIYPPLLADRGLAAALEAQGRRAAVPVELHTDGISRYPQEAEAAVYFCVLEALQNTAKYAGASKAAVRLAASDGHLSFEVRDDGGGFDPSSTGYGTGLQGMADRLAALGGELKVSSAPGQGTTVSGRLPVRALEPMR